MADIGSLLGAAGIGGAIGKAIVSLELDTKKYQAELKAAEGQTIASTNKSSAAFGSFSGFASKALLGVGVAAVAGAALSVKAAIEANAAHLKLQNTFENNESLSDSSVAAFERQADALRELTGVDDEAIITGQALLGQFELTGAQVLELTPRVVDLAAKMDIDLQAAFKAVGKATAGSSGILSRYGIVLDQDALKADAFGTTLEGLGVAAGFAADRAKDEPWRVLGGKLEEIAEDIGQALLPAFQDLVGILEYLLPVVEAIAEGLHLALSAETYTDIPVIGEGFKALGVGIEHVGFAANQTNSEIRRNGLPLLSEMQQKAGLAESGLISLSETFPYVREGAEAAAEGVRKLSKVGKEIADSLAEEVPALRGTADTYKDTFTLSPAELEKITASWARIARTIASDLREIAKSDLTPAMRVAIAELPIEMRHAWVEGNAKQRGAIEASIRTTLSIEKLIPSLARQALLGGQEVGASLMEGVVAGMVGKAPAIAAQAEAAVLRAIAAARTAARAESPSKLMRDLGLDMMEGLYIGISTGAQKAIDAARRETEKLVEQIGSQLDKVKGQAAEFAGSISGAIGAFGGIGSAFGEGEIPVGAVIAQQVGGAQQLASILEALKRQGAGQALLSEVAGAGAGFGQAILAGGPEQVRAANAALQEIASLARQTGKGLSEAFFSDRIDKIERRLERQNEYLRELVEIERAGHDHAIILDGQKVTEAIRSQLIRTGSRNPDVFGGRA